VDLLRKYGLPSEAAFSSLGATLSVAKGAWNLKGELTEPRVSVAGQEFLLTNRIDLHGEGDASIAKLGFQIEPGHGITGSGQANVAPGFAFDHLDELVDRLTASTLDAQLSMSLEDLSTLKPLLESLRTLSGKVDAKFTCGGTVGAPIPVGTLTIEGLEAKAGADLPTMTDGRLHAIVDWPKITLDPLEVQLGYGPVEVRGTVMAPTGEQDASFDLTATGKNVLLARTQYLRVRSDLDLALKGVLNALKLSGTVNVTDVLFSQPIELTASSAPTAPDNGYQLFSFREPPLSTLEFDLKILADRTIRVDNNIVRGTISTDLTLFGTGSVPRPEGRAYFSDLRVQLPFSRLMVERGDIVFEKNAPFSPRLAVNAKTMMRGYSMEVQVNGRLPNTRIQIASEPYLSQQDALALLTLGATPSGLQKEGLSRAALTRIGSLMADSFLSDLMGPSDPDAESIGDRINLEVGRDVSRTGASTIEFEYELKPQLYLRAERDKYDAYNMGAVWRWRFR
jgi:autotransporter translocation and assembly factor TamB